MAFNARCAKAKKDRFIKSCLQEAERKFEENNEAVEDSAVDHLVRTELLAAAKFDRPPQLDTPVVNDELFGCLVSGHETASTTMQWGLKFLAANPDVQDRLRGAIEAWLRTLPGSQPSPEDIARSKIPYLDAVIAEILRCGITAPSIVRACVRDIQVAGYHIPRYATSQPSYSLIFTFSL